MGNLRKGLGGFLPSLLNLIVWQVAGQEPDFTSFYKMCLNHVVINFELPILSRPLFNCLVDPGVLDIPTDLPQVVCSPCAQAVLDNARFLMLTLVLATEMLTPQYPGGLAVENMSNMLNVTCPSHARNILIIYDTVGVYIYIYNMYMSLFKICISCIYIYIWHVYLYMYIRCIYIYIWYVYLCI